MSDDPDSSSPRTPRPTISVAVLSSLWLESLPQVEDLTRRAAAASLSAARMRASSAEVSIALADDATLRGLNREYRGRDAPTNVLSFAVSERAETAGGEAGPLLLGDVILACETVRREALQQGKTLPDHVSHLVVHGVLHLLGFDHEAEVEAEEMERQEVAVLGRLGIADPYACPGPEGRPAAEA